MATQVQFRRGTTTQNNAFTGAIGEITYDTEVKTLRLHDGSNSGGGAIVVNTASAQTLTNKTLSTNSVWNGTAVALGYGGTGAALTAVAGAVAYSTGSALGLTSAGTSGQVLTSGGNSAPTWVNAASITAGSSTNASFATNIAGGSAGQLVIQQDESLTTFITAGASGTFLRSEGAGYAPSWATADITIGSTVIDLGSSTTSLAGLNILAATGTSHWTIPNGTTEQRPASPSAGMIRYNSTQSTFEGYSSGAWSSLGGVKSVDAFTYILAETSAGASNGDLDFYAEDSAGTAATQVGQWNRTNLKDYTGTIVGTQTTQNVFNATATTVNAFGAATTLTIGGTSGTATIRNGTVAVTNNATVGGTLGVTGVTTLTGLINANGGIAVDTNAFTVADTTGNTAIAGTLTVTGATVLNGGLTMDTNKFTVADTTGNTLVGGTLDVTGVVNFNNTTDATSSTAGGALTIDGGLAVAKKLFVGGNADFDGNVQIDGTLTVSGTTTTITATNLAVSDNMIYMNQAISTSITNAVGNGTNVVYTTSGHNYTVGMSVTITGVTPSAYNLSNQTITAVSGNDFTILNAATGTYVSGGTARARSNANPDLGFAFGYYDGTYQHGGLFRDATDGVFKFFKGYTPEPDVSAFIDTADASFAFADLRSAGFTATTGTFSSTLGVTGEATLLSTLHLGHATDTTLARSAAGVVTIEGVEIVTLSRAQTLTNKTINLANNTLTATSAQIAAAVSDETGSGALVFANTPTLVTPVLGVATGTSLALSNITLASNGNATILGTLDLGNASDTTLARSAAGVVTIEGVEIVTLSRAQTLTNKTISGSNNTLSNIANASLTNSSITVGSTAISLGSSATTITGLSSVTSTSFVGALTGNASSATYASAVTLTADNSTNATNYPLFVNAATGNLSPRTDTGFTYNPSTGVLTSTTFSGALTGNVTGNVTGSSGSCTGNAATATTLQTARTIGGVSFNGSANIDLPGVNTTGNQNTTGSAATLTTPRAIQGVNFNGSAAITVLTQGTGVTVSGTQVSIGQAVATSSNVQFNSVGVGTAGSGTAGEILATNAITSYYSDDRLKTRTGNIENALEKVLSLDGFHYYANETAVALGYDASKQEVGLSAQQVQAVLPEVIAPAPIDPQYMTMHYERLVPLLVEAIKEQQKQIEELKAKLGN